MLEQTTEMNLLYDFYGTLLTKKQQFILECYYLDDWSLSEIAEHQGISRQAVFEGIKRAERHLIELENKLGMVAKHRQRERIAKEIRSKLMKHPTLEAEIGELLEQLID
jgi:predicted DNA-binding protein YlxM (UPF0122 family)